MRAPPTLHDFDSRHDATPNDGACRTTPIPDDARPPSPSNGLPGISFALGDEPAPLADLVAERPLGGGGMGVVMLCRQRSLARDVAVKTVRERDPAAVRALVEEARITGSLEHPGIVPVHALGVGADGLPVLVMRRVSGVVWHELVRDPAHRAWTKVRADRLSFHLDVLRKICNVVHFAHGRGVVHRDLKTSNVMVGDSGEVYVLDWGIACAEGSPDAGAQHARGTPGYMAPEMLTPGAEPITARTDVYMLGAMLHEVLTGHARHHGATLLEVLRSVQQSAPFEYPADVPPELAALCNRAMRRDSARRVPDARAFAEALATFQEHRASERRTDAALEHLDALRALTPGSQHALARGLWIEASFGFRRALEAWCDNPRALEGRREATEWMVRHELARRDADGAAALLSELDPAPPELAGAVSRLREELAREATEVARLRSEAQELYTCASAWGRAVVSMALLAILLVIEARGALARTYATLAVALASLLAFDRRLLAVGGTTLLATFTGATSPDRMFEAAALMGLFASVGVARRLR